MRPVAAGPLGLTATALPPSSAAAPGKTQADDTPAAHDDRLSGKGGRDELTGGSGSDAMFGGKGSDLAFARDGEPDLVKLRPGS